jgi:serine/threonine protein kinase
LAEGMISDPLGLSGRTLASTYKVLQPIGAGGFGVVYRALHLMLNRQVAVKVQRTSPGLEGRLIERFRREAEACWRLRNVGAVEVYDCRTDPDTGRLFFAMELLQGRSLAMYWLLAKRLPIGEAVRYVLSVARCMAVAHDHGIIHRDLKPENIFLCEDGSIRILDFGSALMVNATRLTKPGEFLGTTCYMPEEQLVRPTGELDGRADIYALGVVLYHLLSGRMVYAPDQDLRVLRGRILRENPPDIKSVAPFVSDDLARVIRRALARDREARPATMRDFIEELQRAAGGTDSLSDPDRTGASSVLPPTVESVPSPSLLGLCSTSDDELMKTIEHNAPVLTPDTATGSIVHVLGDTQRARPIMAPRQRLPVTVQQLKPELRRNSSRRSPADTMPPVIRQVDAQARRNSSRSSPVQMKPPAEDLAGSPQRKWSRVGIAALGALGIAIGGLVVWRITTRTSRDNIGGGGSSASLSSPPPRTIPTIQTAEHVVSTPRSSAPPAVESSQYQIGGDHLDSAAHDSTPARPLVVPTHSHRRRTTKAIQESAPAKVDEKVRNADLFAPEF